jgi:hypothetical protein
MTDNDWFQKYVGLSEAVRDLYFAAHWSADRRCNHVKLWEAVRDAAGIPPGNSPVPK